MPLLSNLKEQFSSITKGRVRFGEPMAQHTTFRIGGPAEVWAQPEGVEELKALLKLAREEKLPVTLIGGGANLLVRDEGVPGLVLHLQHQAFQLCQRTPEGISAGAALPLEWLVRRAQEWGLSGLEFLAGVPGRVGGAVRMNAGTHDEEGNLHAFCNVLESVMLISLDGIIETVPKESIPFTYRSGDLDSRIVLEANLTLTQGDPEAIAERVKRLWDFKKRTQDWSAPSVGCIFKNPPGQSAGWLVDQAGLKGRQVGQAQISRRHANFIMNLGQAQASDVLSLIGEAQTQVRSRFNIELELEVQVVPPPSLRGTK